MEKEKSIKLIQDRLKSIHLSGIDHSNVEIFEIINNFIFKKIPLSKLEINNILIDFYLKYDEKNSEYDLDDKIFTAILLGFLIPYLEKNKENREYIDNLVKLILLGLRYNFIRIKNLIEFIINTDYNVYLYMGLEDKILGMEDRSLTNRLIDYAYKKNIFEESFIKRFFVYALSNDNFVKLSDYYLIEYYPNMGKTLQRFIAFKTDLFHWDRRSYDSVTTILNDPKVEDIVKLQINKKFLSTKSNTNEYELFHSYFINLTTEALKIVFPNEKKFYNKLKTMIEKNGLLVFLERTIESSNSDPKQILTKLIEFYPEILRLLDNIDTEKLAEMKYGEHYEKIPDKIIEVIKLPMTDEVVWDSDDIKSFIDDSDRHSNPEIMVAYIDSPYRGNGLYDFVDYYDYDITDDGIKDYYFDDINDENLEIIKNFIRKKYPDVDIDDEDELMDACLEDDDLSNAIRNSIQYGLESGDVNKLERDCAYVLDELFGKGDWEHDEITRKGFISGSGKTIGGIKTKISLSDFDDEDIRNAYNDCGEWDVKCLWSTIKSDYYTNDKPGFNHYYGYGGDFDKIYFNERLLEELPS